MTGREVAKRVRIEGLVQGVGYRAWLEREAVRHGLTGWVRNRRDGGVEAVLAGPEAHVDLVVARCHDGPRSARVDMVKVLPETDPPSHGFSVLPTA